MEYEDYKTKQPISREQYIKNGLERGELLIKEECGCVVIQDITADAYIVGCAKHEAAEDMYEALTLYILWIEGSPVGSRTLIQINEMIMDARAKARGK